MSNSHKEQLMKLETDFFKDLYLKAKLSFNECILNPDNDHLNNEINTSISEITLKEDFIRLQFFEHETEQFMIEVKLKLISADNNLIGSYSYYENEERTPLDDFLIFD